MNTFEGEIIKSDYGLDTPIFAWWVKNKEQDIDDGEFAHQVLSKIGEGKKVRITIDEIDPTKFETPKELFDNINTKFYILEYKATFSIYFDIIEIKIYTDNVFETLEFFERLPNVNVQEYHILDRDLKIKLSLTHEKREEKC